MERPDETITDIIAKVRKQAKLERKNADRLQKRGDAANYGIGCSIEEDANYLESIADNLGAACKRERGNVAKLREALKDCLLYIACAESVGIGTITLNDKMKLNPRKIIKSAKEALATTEKEGCAR